MPFFHSNEMLSSWVSITEIAILMVKWQKKFLYTFEIRQPQPEKIHVYKYFFLDYFWSSGPLWMQSSLYMYHVFQIHFWRVLLCRSIKMTPKTATSKIRIPYFKVCFLFPLFSFLQMWPPFFHPLAFLSFSLFLYFCAASEFQFKIWWEGLRMKMMAYFRLRSFLYIFLEGTSLWSQFPIKAWFCFAWLVVNILKNAHQTILSIFIFFCHYICRL